MISITRARPYILPILSFIYCTVTTTSLRAQTVVDTTFANQMNIIFSNLDKTKIPFGILRDYGMEFTELDQFNGSAVLADSNCADITTFWDVYNTLITSRISSSATGFIRTGLLDTNWNNARQQGIVTIMGLYFNYSRFRDDAANTYVTITNNQLYDKFVGGVWQNPYISQKAFVMCPSITEYTGLSFQVKMPANLWLSNNTLPYTISVDFHDGSGYRQLTAGTPLAVSYATPGIYEWTYKLVINAVTYYSHTKVQINADVDGSVTYTNHHHSLAMLRKNI